MLANYQVVITLGLMQIYDLRQPSLQKWMTDFTSCCVKLQGRAHLVLSPLQVSVSILLMEFKIQQIHELSALLQCVCLVKII